MSFPKYPEYKPSGVEWLGEVPGHWNTLALKYLLQLKSGDTITADSISDVGIYPVYGGNGLRGFTDQFTHEGEHVLVGRQGALCGNINYASGRFWASEHAVVCTPRRELAHRWLGELLRAMNLGQYSISAAQPGLSVEAISRLHMPLPPLAEQHAIAAFLDRETARIDAMVVEQERLIELLREKRQAVISHAVTKGLDPTVPMKDSGVEWLGEVPAHWEVGPLKTLFGLKHGFAFDGNFFSDTGEFVLMTPGHFHETGGFRARDAEKFYSDDSFPREFVLNSGQLLVAMTEQAPGLLGSALFVPEGVTYLHNQRLGLVHQVREDRLSVRFLFHVCNSSQFRHVVSISATGSKVRHTSPGRILSTLLALPPIGEQDAIAIHLDIETARIDTLITEAERAITLLQERRAALISAAVTGQIDVRGLAPEPSA